MKKLYIITLLLSITQFVQSQFNDPKSTIIEEGETFVFGQQMDENTSYDFTASEYIKLEGGFEYGPNDGNYFVAKNDPLMVITPPFVEGGPNPDPNTIVGTIPGSLSVSSTGAAIYTIPIDLPQGINGMTPELALVYNSQAGDGIMGKGWSIGGWSFISRSNTSIYYDDAPGSVTFENNDAFLLDGKRLIYVSDDFGVFYYRTEIDEISKVIRNSSFKEGKNDTHWIVYTKSGLKKEYGTNSHSQQTYGASSNESVRYHLRRITDNMGNYIEYDYDNNTSSGSDGEVYLSSIMYTGNNDHGIDPFYEITFDYTYLSDSEFKKNYFQYNGEPYYYMVKKILTGLAINHIPGSGQSTNIKTYSINYTDDGILNKPYLTSIGLEAANDNVLSPTVFNWECNTVEDNEPVTLSSSYYCPSSDYIGQSILSGNFNKDLSSDIIEGNENGFQIRLSGQYGQIAATHDDSFLGEKIIADFNGDGIDELMIYYDEDLVFYKFQVNGATLEILEISTLLSVDMPIIGDFNGDGLNDCYLKDNNSIYFGTPNIDDFLGSPITISGLPDLDTYRVIDSDGDGKSEIMNILYNESNFYEVLLQGSSYSFTKTFTDQSISINNYPMITDISVGDFNADGLQDLLLSHYKNGETFERLILYSFGEGFMPGSEINATGIYNFDLKITDLNNDGFSDILYYGIKSFGENSHPEVRVWSYKCIKQPSANFEFNVVPKYQDYESDIPGWYYGAGNHITVGDISGNGEADLIYAITKELDEHQGEEGELWRYIDVIKENGIADDLITTIENGFGVQTTINYSTHHYSDTENTATSYPINNYLKPFAVVNNVSSGNFPPTYYTYKAPKIHLTGKGLLGFKETTIKNLNAGTYTYSETDFYDNGGSGFFYYPYPKLIEQSSLDENGDIDKLISRTQNLIDHKLTTDKDLIFLPFVTKSLTNSWDNDDAHTYIKTVKTEQDEADLDGYGNSKKYFVKTDPDLITNFTTTGYDYYTKIENTYDPIDLPEPIDNVFWWVNRIESTTTENKYSTLVADINKTEYGYYPDGHNYYPLLESVTNDPNSSTPEEEYYITQTIYNDYDIVGNLLKKTVQAPNDDLTGDRVTTYGYDNDGFLGYDHRFLTSITKTMGGQQYIEGFEYDVVMGKKTQSFIVEDGEHKNETFFEYDEFGKLDKSTYPNNVNSKTVFRWSDDHVDSPSGAMFYTWTKQSGTAKAISFFDKYERKIRTVTKGFGTDEKIYINYTYNQKGLLNEVSEPYYSTSSPNQGDCTTYDYDNLNRLWHETTPSGVVTTNTYAGKTTTKGSTIDGVAISVSKTVNAIGLPITITEKSGTTTFGIITYQYNSARQPTTIDAMGNITTMTYDLAGNQESLDDPNAGLTKYMYSPFGERIFQGRINIQVPPDEKYKYETVTTLGDFGRLESQTLTNNEDPAYPVSETTFYEYYDIESGNGKGKLKKTGIVGGIEYEYVYDEYGRVLSETETIEGVQYETSYVYDVFGRLKEHTSPSGFVSKNYYTANGDHGKIKHDGNALWELTATNKRGQATGYNLGNGLTTEFGYDSYGFPESIVTGGGIIQDLEFTFHPQTGNLMQRKNNKGTSQGNDLVEDFTYDDLMKSRLETWEVFGLQSGGYSISYTDPDDTDNNGNIYTKSDVTQTNGSFVYGDDAGPHAVTSITNPTGHFFNKAKETQTIEYTAFEKVKYIEQDVIIDDVSGEINTFRIDFVYGPGHARKKTILTNVTTGETIKIKTYAGNCEYEEDGSGNTRILTYVANVGIYVEENNQGNLYYVHADYLGNYQAISDETGDLVEELSFDPWGRRRNADDWSFTNVPETYMFDRGFTGHEHLDVFAIINMNGRIYDPWLGRFLSADNFVQAPEYSQNYNRYAYAYNNPLKYTDPDGEWLHLAIGALIGGTANLIANWNNIDNFGQGLAYFGVGAAAGGLAAGIGAGIGGLVGGTGSFSFGVANSLSVGGVFPGMAIGGASGFTNGFLSGLGNGIVQGNSFNDAANRGLNMGVSQGIAGAITGGISGGFRAAKYNGNIWTGKPPGASPIAKASIILPEMRGELNVGGRVEMNPFYEGSDLSFDGYELKYYDYYSDGSEKVVGSWVAVSGAGGNNALPEGTYFGDNLRLRTKITMVRDDVGFSLDLSDAWDPNLNRTRTYLRIHPDGQGGGSWWIDNGTDGCIGLQGCSGELNSFYTLALRYKSNNVSWL